jgi:hypothetical protein
MPGYLAHVGALIQCAHAGPAQVVTTNARVKVMGQFVALQNDQYMVSGCPFTVPPGTPLPCVTIQFVVPALRVKVMGQPVILKDSVGICIPNGVPPQVNPTQVRVKGM